MTSRATRGQPLRVAVLSSASGGGAGIAARRVADAMNLRDDLEVDFLDMIALGGRIPGDAAPPGNMSNQRITDTHFTVEFPGFMRGWIIELLGQYDVLNVHWASYLMGISELDELSRQGMPMLFTCHDYYYFTGGCHYPATCQLRMQGCVACPQVNTRWCSQNVIAENLKIKRRILSRKNVHLSAPSAFLVSEAKEARMIQSDKAHVLRNPYTPERPLEAKQPGPRHRIALIADSLVERRKGMPLAIEALSRVQERLRGKPFVVEIIGHADEALISLLSDSGLEYVLHGKISVHRQLVDVIASCDCLLTCSNEDNWPNVLVEAGSYGVVPIVGPDHGCEEFSRHFGIAHIATGYTPEAFAHAIGAALRNADFVDSKEFAGRVREAHDPQTVAASYASIIGALVPASNAVSADEKTALPSVS